MDIKILVFAWALCVSAVSWSVVPAAALEYSYGYDVADALTGDYKGHTEQRQGDLVTGSYSVVEPDGTRRTVDYSADARNGFNAVVRREPLVVPGAPVYARPYLAPVINNPNYFY